MQQYKLFFLLLSVLLSLGSASISQPSQIKRTWHWYFGNHAGIDFSSGTAVADTNGALVTSEGCAAISDTSGVLQFYSDGRTVWNRNHQVMPNGTGIMGGANGSSTQQALIIPKPQSPNIYYLFTTDEAENLGANGMRYTVIDMNLDGGNGDVITSQKNILLFAPCTEKLAAVNHCNDTNVWVMGHEVNNNHFRAYLVTSNGIDTNAVVSAVGFPNMNNVLGQLNGPIKFSSNGKMICQVTDTSARRVELLQFDNYLGAISNGIIISTNNWNYAISFSPDNSKLYVGNNGTGELYQYDVTVFDSTIINASKFLVDSLAGIGAHRPRYSNNASDGSIYFGMGGMSDYFSAIYSPNISGAGCQFNFQAINFPLPTYAGSGSVNYNESYFNQSPSSGCTTGIEENNKFKFKLYPNPARDWIVVEGNEISEVEIYNLQGEKIFEETSLPSTNHTVNLTKFSGGFYFVKIKAHQNISVQKLIIN